MVFEMLKTNEQQLFPIWSLTCTAQRVILKQYQAPLGSQDGYLDHDVANLEQG